MNEQVIQAIEAFEAALSAPPAAPPSWDSFEKALASSLLVLDDEFLVLSTRGGNRFVQFAVDPALGIFAETVSNAFLGPDEKLDAGQLADLVSMGWAAPTHAPHSPDPVPVPDGSPNHFREFKRPFSCSEVAAFAVRTLTGPLRVGSPAELEYRASDEAGHTVTLPALEIAREARPRPKASPPAKSKGPSPFQNTVGSQTGHWCSPRWFLLFTGGSSSRTGAIWKPGKIKSPRRGRHAKRIVYLV